MNFEHVNALNKSGDVTLVRSSDDGNLYVHKKLYVYDKSIYQKLRNASLPGIPKIYECHERKGCLYLIEEFIEGDSLESILKKNGPFPVQQALQILVQICNILRPLHESNPVIIHRDIKPSNVLVRKDGSVFLIDFNASKEVDPRKTEDTVLIGTPEYAAPEQYGFSQSDAKTDIYALGVLLNMLLTGTTPKTRICEGKPRPIVKRCTNMDPGQRYSSVKDLKAALVKIQKNEKIPASFAPPGFRAKRPAFMIPAAIGYMLLFALTLTMTLDEYGSEHQWKFKVFSLIWLLSLALFYGNYLNIHQRLPLTKSSIIPLKIIGLLLYGFIISFVVLSILALIIEV